MKYETLDRAILEAITSTPGIKFNRMHRITPVAVASQALADAGDKAPAWRIVDRRLQALRKKELIFARNGWHPVFEEIK